MVNKSDRKMIGIIGPTCVGKSHYIRGLLRQAEGANANRPVVLSIGDFFRKALGPTFFSDLDNPAAPAETENWVRSMVHHSIMMAYFYGKVLITDCFPRTPLQLDWLMLSSGVSTYTFEVELIFLRFASKEQQERRIRERKEANKDGESKLLDIRLAKDIALIDGLYTAAIAMEKENDKLTVTERIITDEVAS